MRGAAFLATGAFLAGSFVSDLTFGVDGVAAADKGVAFVRMERMSSLDKSNTLLVVGGVPLPIFST